MIHVINSARAPHLLLLKDQVFARTAQRDALVGVLYRVEPVVNSTALVLACTAVAEVAIRHASMGVRIVPQHAQTIALPRVEETASVVQVVPDAQHLV